VAEKVFEITISATLSSRWAWNAGLVLGGDFTEVAGIVGNNPQIRRSGTGGYPGTGPNVVIRAGDPTGGTAVYEEVLGAVPPNVGSGSTLFSASWSLSHRVVVEDDETDGFGPNYGAVVAGSLGGYRLVLNGVTKLDYAVQPSSANPASGLALGLLNAFLPYAISQGIHVGVPTYGASITISVSATGYTPSPEVPGVATAWGSLTNRTAEAEPAPAATNTTFPGQYVVSLHRADPAGSPAFQDTQAKTIIDVMTTQMGGGDTEAVPYAVRFASEPAAETGTIGGGGGDSAQVVREWGGIRLGYLFQYRRWNYFTNATIDSGSASGTKYYVGDALTEVASSAAFPAAPGLAEVKVADAPGEQPYYRYSGKEAPAATVTHAADAHLWGASGLAFADYSDATGGWLENTPGLSLSYPGGVLQADATALGSGSAYASWRCPLAVGRTLLGYRYLTVRFRTVGAANKAIRFFDLVGPSVTSGADGEWVEVDIDAMAGNTWRRREFINQPGPPTTLYQDFNVLVPAGCVTEIEWIKGHRDNPTRLSIFGNTEGGTFTLARMHAFTDGMETLSLAPGVSGAGLGTIALVAAAVNDRQGWTGWSMAALDTGSKYYSQGVGAAHLESGGDFRGVPSALDLALAPSGTLNVRHVAPAVSPTALGTPAEGADDSDADPDDERLYHYIVCLPQGGLAAASLFGGADKIAAATVEAHLESDSSSRGDGTPGADGFAALGAPYLRSRHDDATRDHRFSVTGSGLTAAPLTPSSAVDGADYVYPAPWMQRLHWPWRLFGIFEWLSMDVSATGRLVRVGTVDENIAIAFSSDYPGQEWSDEDTGIPGETPTVRYEFQSAVQRVWLAYQSSDDILLRYSDDEGVTWSMPATVWGSGSYPAFEILPTGMQYHYIRTTGGGIDCKLLDQFHNVVAGPLTAVASGVDDAPFAVRFDESAQRFYLVYSSGGLATTVVSDDGETFT